MKHDGPTPPGDLLRRGWELHQTGRLQQAEAIYREVLQQQPNHPGALHLLGMLERDCNQPAAAIELFDRAIALNPNIADFHFQRAITLESLRKLPEAVEAYRAGLALQPDYAEAQSNLGNVLFQLDRPIEAERACRAAIALKPALPAPYSNLGNALRAQSRRDEAIDAYRSALRLDPAFGDAALNLGNLLFELARFPEAIDAFRTAAAHLPNPAVALNNLGNTLLRFGPSPEAESALRRSIALDPAAIEPLNNLGNLLTATGQLDEAIECFRRAIAIRPDNPEAHSNLASTCVAAGELSEAVALFERAIALRPDFGVAYTNLGHALRALRRPEAAVEAYRRAVELLPDVPEARGNLLYGLHFLPEIDAESLFREHEAFARLVEQPIKPHATDRDPNRRLRVGFVSPDLRDHPVGRFILPLFEAHDRAHFDFIAFAETRSDDAIARKLKANCIAWHITIGRSDDDVAQLIRDEKIDILIDLAGHTAQNRLPVFARKPAPVSMTYLGYPNTTGLRAIDYRLTDACADPVGQTESLHTETLLRLPETAWCFHPPDDSPEVAPLPCDAAGHITFGSFNNLAKVNDALIALWSHVLARVPDSRVLLKAGGLRDTAARQGVLDAFASHGISADRIALLSTIEGVPNHLSAYAKIDIALDSFPYHGTTTTCEALWMGVPVITMAGRTHVSRVGASLLRQVGLDELIAESRDQYVSVASNLAEDRARLREFRASLRSRMLESQLLDIASFARRFEQAIRTAWQTAS